MKPKIDIEISPETGVWSSDGLPMFYAPRHWVMGIHKDVEAALGREAYVELLYKRGYHAAQQWCAQQSELFGFRDMDLLRHYLKKSSDRGLAQFTLLLDTIELGKIEISLHNCCYVLHHHHVSPNEPSQDTQCFAFAGSFAGAADWIAQAQGLEHRFVGRERECAAQARTDTCVIELISASHASQV